MHSQIFKGVQQSFKAKTGFVGDYGLTACDGISRCDPITRWSAVCFRLHTSKCVFYICTAVCYLYYLHLIYYFLISSCCLEVCRGFPLVVLSINRRCCRREKKTSQKKKRALIKTTTDILQVSLCLWIRSSWPRLRGRSWDWRWLSRAGALSSPQWWWPTSSTEARLNAVVSSASGTASCPSMGQASWVCPSPPARTSSA